MNKYKTTIHIRCPFQPVWDYYSVVLFSAEMVQCEAFEECCEVARGKSITQESAADLIHGELTKHIPELNFTVKVTGRHGANCKAVISR